MSCRLSGLFLMAFLVIGCEVSYKTGDPNAPLEIGASCDVYTYGIFECDETGTKILRCDSGHWVLQSDCAEEDGKCAENGNTTGCVPVIADEDGAEEEESDTRDDFDAKNDLNVDTDKTDNASPDADTVKEGAIAPGADCSWLLEQLGENDAYACYGEQGLYCADYEGSHWRTWGDDCAVDGMYCHVSDDYSDVYCASYPADTDPFADLDTTVPDTQSDAVPDVQSDEQPDVDASTGTVPCGVFYVDIDSSVAVPDGLAWGTAFRTLNEAITAAANLTGGYAPDPRCEIWVAEGTYYIYKSAVSDSITLFPGFDLYGGFTGNETTREVRDTKNHLSILDGANGPSATKKVRHVVIASNDSLLDGFTIRGGSAQGNDPEFNGGGLLALNAAPTIRDCIFTANNAAMSGGAIYSKGGSPVIERCRFEANVAKWDGGAVASVNGSPRIADTFFVDNSGAHNAGAMLVTNGIAEFVNCVFLGNSTPNQGGAMLNYQGASVLITNSTFSGNTAKQGAAVYNASSSYPVIANSIFWGNTATDLNQISGNAPTVSFSDVEGVSYQGEGNISADPRFVDVAVGDVRLTDASPCIDAAKGEIGDFTSPVADIEGAARYDFAEIVDTGIGVPSYVDMGAYEFY